MTRSTLYENTLTRVMYSQQEEEP